MAESTSGNCVSRAYSRMARTARAAARRSWSFVIGNSAVDSLTDFGAIDLTSEALMAQRTGIRIVSRDRTRQVDLGLTFE